jgi:hypothetical protein
VEVALLVAPAALCPLLAACTACLMPADAVLPATVDLPALAAVRLFCSRCLPVAVRVATLAMVVEGPEGRAISCGGGSRSGKLQQNACFSGHRDGHCEYGIKATRAQLATCVKDHPCMPLCQPGTAACRCVVAVGHGKLMKENRMVCNA